MKRIAIFAASVMLAAVFASCGKETGKYGINDKASDEVKVFDKKVEGEADLIDKAEALQSKVDDIFMKNNVYVELYVDADNDGTYETVIKKDITLITSATNGGKATDVKSYALTHTLENVQNDVSYYGFVLDGNNNKTELAVTTIRSTACTEHSYDDGVVTKEPTYGEDGEIIKNTSY